MFASKTLLAVAAILASTTVDGFAPVRQQQTKSTQTALNMGNTKLPPAVPPIQDISYGEESRKYRRTIFTHDDWVKYRSPDRFWRNLSALTSSGIYKNVGKEILATTGVATFVVVWNCLVGGFDTLDGGHVDAIINSPLLPVAGLPLAPFTLASPSLGLLLGTYVRSGRVTIRIVGSFR